MPGQLQLFILTPQDFDVSENPDNNVRAIAQMLKNGLSGTGSQYAIALQGVVPQTGTATYATGHLYLEPSVTTDSGDYSLTIDGGTQSFGTAPFASQAACQAALVGIINTQFLDWRVALNVTAVAFENVPYTEMVTGDTITVDGVVFTANTDLPDDYTGDSEFNPARFGITGACGSQFCVVMQRHSQFHGKVCAAYSNTVFTSFSGTWTGGVLSLGGIDGNAAPASVEINSSGVGQTVVTYDAGNTDTDGLGRATVFYFHEARDHYANYTFTNGDIVTPGTGLQPTSNTPVQGYSDDIERVFQWGAF